MQGIQLDGRCRKYRSLATCTSQEYNWRRDAGKTGFQQPSHVRNTTGEEMQRLSQTQETDALLPLMDPRMLVRRGGAGTEFSI